LKSHINEYSGHFSYYENVAKYPENFNNTRAKAMNTAQNFNPAMFLAQSIENLRELSKQNARNARNKRKELIDKALNTSWSVQTDSPRSKDKQKTLENYMDGVVTTLASSSTGGGMPPDDDDDKKKKKKEPSLIKDKNFFEKKLQSTVEKVYTSLANDSDKVGVGNT
jgi:hypothetical protein